MTDVNKLTIKQLILRCKELNIKNYSSKNKNQIIELLNNNTKKITENTDKNNISENILKEDLIKENLIKENMDKNNIRFVDLFCGIGGFHQALKRLGANCVFACDIDAKYRLTY